MEKSRIAKDGSIVTPNYVGVVSTGALTLTAGNATSKAGMSIGGGNATLSGNCPLVLGSGNTYDNTTYGTAMVRNESYPYGNNQHAIGIIDTTSVPVTPIALRIYGYLPIPWETTNHERAKLGWESNVFVLGTEAAGTGTKRNMKLDSANRSPYIASPTAAEIRDILISFGLMAPS